MAPLVVSICLLVQYSYLLSCSTPLLSILPLLFLLLFRRRCCYILVCWSSLPWEHQCTYIRRYHLPKTIEALKWLLWTETIWFCVLYGEKELPSASISIFAHFLDNPHSFASVFEDPKDLTMHCFDLMWVRLLSFAQVLFELYFICMLLLFSLDKVVDLCRLYCHIYHLL